MYIFFGCLIFRLVLLSLEYFYIIVYFVSLNILITIIKCLPLYPFRYLKSLFQKAEETFILDILAGSDNNVQKASEKLLKMGYEKRDISAPRVSLRKTDDNKKDEVTFTPIPTVKSIDEKKKSKTYLIFFL